MEVCQQTVELVHVVNIILWRLEREFMLEKILISIFVFISGVTSICYAQYVQNYLQQRLQNDKVQKTYDLNDAARMDMDINSIQNDKQINAVINVASANQINAVGL